MTNIIKKIQQNGSLARHFAVLMSSTVLSQLLLFGSSPLLTRLYTPQDFGIFGLVMAITTILSIIVTGRYELAIMLPKETSESFNIVVLASGLTIGGSTIVLLLLIITPMDYLMQLGIGDLGGLLYLIPFLVMFQSLYQILYYWLNRQQRYGSMAKTRLQLVLIATIVSVAIGYTQIVAGGLILSQIVAYLGIILIITRQIWGELIALALNVNLNTLLSQVRRYLDFPKYLIVAHSMEALSAQLPVIMLNFLFNGSVAGYFTLTQRVIGAPVSFIAKTMGDIIRERFSCEYREKGNCYLTFIKCSKYLVALALVPAILFGLWGPNLFSIVFGPAWTTSGTYARLLAVMTFFQMIASPLSVMYMIAEKQKVELYLQFVRVSLCFIAFYAGYYAAGTAELSIIQFGVVMSGIYAFMIYQSKTWSNAGMRSNHSV